MPASIFSFSVSSSGVYPWSPGVAFYLACLAPCNLSSQRVLSPSEHTQSLPCKTQESQTKPQQWERKTTSSNTSNQNQRPLSDTLGPRQLLLLISGHPRIPSATRFLSEYFTLMASTDESTIINCSWVMPTIRWSKTTPLCSYVSWTLSSLCPRCSLVLTLCSCFWSLLTLWTRWHSSVCPSVYKGSSSRSPPVLSSVALFIWTVSEPSQPHPNYWSRASVKQKPAVTTGSYKADIKISTSDMGKLKLGSVGRVSPVTSTSKSRIPAPFLFTCDTTLGGRILSVYCRLSRIMII